MKSIRVFIIALAAFAAFELVALNWRAQGASVDPASLAEELKKVRELAQNALSEARLARSEAQSLRSQLASIRGTTQIPQAADNSTQQADVSRLEEQVEINSERIKEQSQS